MALELAVRAFRAFPGAAIVLRRAVIVVLYVTLLTVLAAPSGGGYVDFVSELQPRVLNGSIWLFTAIAGLILWYRLPMHRLYKAVLLSYVPYVLVFTMAVRYIGQGGWHRGQAVQYANQVAYVLMLAVWNAAIWKRDPIPAPAPSPPPPPTGSP
jgi:hypothetical protein